MKLAGVFSAVLALTAAFGAEAAKPEAGPDHQCTSWIVFSDLTRDGTNILHKNRDASSRKVIMMRSADSSPRKWIGMGSRGRVDYVCMGLNASGLAGVMNSGEPTHENTIDLKWTGRGTAAMLRDILENCDTAAQAAGKVRSFIERKDYRDEEKQGTIFLFVDTKEGYIVEFSAGSCSSRRYDRGYVLRANLWRNPGMAKLAASPWKRFLGNSIREYAVMSALNRTLAKKGRLGVADMLAVARNCEEPKRAPLERRVCYKYTNSTSTLVVDREYPDVLSTGYMNIGYPRHTVCVPVPVCIGQLDERMTDLSWSGAAVARFDKFGYDAPMPEKWVEFEEKSRTEYASRLAEARKLLKAGKKDAAVALVNASAAKIWNEAAKLLGR